MSTIFGIDGNWYLHRIFHTVTYETDDKNQAIAWAFLRRVCQDAIAVKANEVVVAFDGDSVFRYDLFSGYKGERGDNSEVYESLPAVIALLKEACIPVIQRKKYEADDILCSLARKYGSTHSVVIGTKDKDSYQYLVKGVRLYDSSFRTKGVLTPRYVRPSDVESLFGVPQPQALAYQCLVGDGIDGVPGVVGPATARKGLAKWGTLRNWLAHDPDLASHMKELKRNRSLVRLRSDVLPSKFDPSFVKSTSDRMPKGYHAWVSVARPKSKGLF